MVQVEYFLSVVASASSTACPALSTSALSNSKNTGLRGELRFKSSSDAVAIVSSRVGSGGTTGGSATGSGGAGGRCGAVVGAGGGGVGRATGGVLWWHAARAIARTTRNKSAAVEAADRVR